jgi:response regulator RpfG family c-di-GMP phosphodiesterase
MAPPVPRVLDRLAAEQKISRNDYERVVGQWRRSSGGPIEETILELEVMSEAELLKALAAIYKTRFVTTEKLSTAAIDRETLMLVPRKVAERYNVFPVLLDRARATLSIVTSDPDNVQATEEVRVVSGMRVVTPLVARPLAIKAAIAKAYAGDARAFAAIERKNAMSETFSNMLDVYGGRQPAQLPSAMQVDAIELTPDSGPAPGPVAVRAQPAARAAVALKELGGAGPPVLELEVPAVATLPTPTPQPAPVIAPAPASQAAHALVLPNPPRPARVSEAPAPPTVPTAAWLETLNVLVSLLENNRPDLRGHSSHVARLTQRLCERLKLGERDIPPIVAAAHLHDLGKASSYHLTALNVAEYGGHRIAAEKSFLTASRLMASARLPEATVQALNHMYERFDGKGFPDQQGAKDIPLGARILSITDTYADLTQNPRNPFRKQLRPIEASEVLAKYEGQIFDDALVDLFRLVVTGDDIKNKLLSDRREALLVDPDPEETTVLELRMIEAGFEVKTVRTAEKALEAIAEEDFELIVTEVDLQPMDGFALLETARRSDKGRAATWVFHSARADREDVNRGFELGAADYVQKPAKAEIFVAKLRKLVEQGAPKQAARAAVAGSLEEMGLTDMVQILAQGRKTGALKIRSGSETGELHFVAGEIFNAVFGKRSGDDAFYDLLKLKTGDFLLDPNFKAEQRLIHESAEGLLLEAMRRLDEGVRG